MPDRASQSLAVRVRRASSRWPITELDEIERTAFARAVGEARDFDDLDPEWQRLITLAEAGRPAEGQEFFLELRQGRSGPDEDAS